MKRIVPSKRFRRAFRRYVRRHPELRQRIEVVIEQMAVDVFAPVLETHLLKGKLEGFQSCSCGYDCRILFRIEEEEIILLDIGTHDEVY
jgi:mRNA interferase YafQ